MLDRLEKRINPNITKTQKNIITSSLTNMMHSLELAGTPKPVIASLEDEVLEFVEGFSNELLPSSPEKEPEKEPANDTQETEIAPDIDQETEEKTEEKSEEKSEEKTKEKPEDQKSEDQKPEDTSFQEIDDKKNETSTQE